MSYETLQRPAKEPAFYLLEVGQAEPGTEIQDMDEGLAVDLGDQDLHVAKFNLKMVGKPIKVKGLTDQESFKRGVKCLVESKTLPLVVHTTPEGKTMLQISDEDLVRELKFTAALHPGGDITSLVFFMLKEANQELNAERSQILEDIKVCNKIKTAIGKNLDNINILQQRIMEKSKKDNTYDDSVTTNIQYEEEIGPDGKPVLDEHGKPKLKVDETIKEYNIDTLDAYGDPVWEWYANGKPYTDVNLQSLKTLKEAVEKNAAHLEDKEPNTVNMQSIKTLTQAVENNKEVATNKQQRLNAVYNNIDQKVNQIFNIMSLVQKSLQEGQGKVISNIR